MTDRRLNLAALLADPARIADVPAAELPAIALRLAALQSALAARLQVLAGDHDGDDCACFSTEEVSRLLGCSVDLIRERGEEWGIARVLSEDSRGRPTRIVYPKALLRAYLSGKPARNGKSKELA